MRHSLFILFAAAIATGFGQANQEFVFYATVHSTLDKSKSPERAQFGGDNKLLNVYLNQKLGELKHATIAVNRTCEMTFKIDSSGNVDSLRLDRSTGHVALDAKLAGIIQATSGKWRVGKVDKTTRGEWNRIWVHLYIGELNKKTLDEYLQDAENLSLENKDEKALIAINKALHYDALNSAATILKGKILIKLARKTEACSLWQSFDKYKHQAVQDQYNKNCQ